MITLFVLLVSASPASAHSARSVDVDLQILRAGSMLEKVAAVNDLGSNDQDDPDRVRDALVEALQNVDWMVRRDAVTHLGFRKEFKALEAVQKIATDDPRPEVQKAAEGAIATIKNGWQYGVWAAISEKRGWDRARAAFGLTSGPPDLIIPVLMKALNDSDDNVRSNAAMALGHWGAAAATSVPNLIALYEKPVDYVASTTANHIAVAQALGAIGSPEAKTWLLARFRARDFIVIENALPFFVGQGTKEIEKGLLSFLDSKLTINQYTLVTHLIACGNHELEAAARDYAAKNNLQITPPFKPVKWGESAERATSK